MAKKKNFEKSPVNKIEINSILFAFVWLFRKKTLFEIVYQAIIFHLPKKSMDQNWNFLIFFFALFRKEIERGPNFNIQHITWNMEHGWVGSFEIGSNVFFFLDWKEFCYAFVWEYQKGFYLLNELREKKFESKEFVCFLISRSNFSLDSINLNTFDLDFIAKNMRSIQNHHHRIHTAFFRSHLIDSRYKTCLIQLFTIHGIKLWLFWWIFRMKIFLGSLNSPLTLVMHKIPESVNFIRKMSKYGTNLFITKIETSKFTEQWTFDYTTLNTQWLAQWVNDMFIS